MATHAPSWLPSGDRAPRPAHAVPRPVAGVLAALAGCAVLALLGTAEPGSVPRPAAPAPAEPCVSPAAVATFAAWPAVAVAAADDPAEVQGERRPDALAVPPEFRAFQDCRRPQAA